MEEQKKKCQYQIGHVKIELHMPKDMLVPENLEKFACKCGEADRIYQMEYAASLAEVEERIRKWVQRECPDAREIQRETIKVLTVPGMECRIMNFQGSLQPYGILLEETKRNVQEKSGSLSRVWVAKEAASMLRYDTVFILLLALEKLMLEHDSLILHSAYMHRNGKAVLFSAPSETGKSTQADLWEKYRGTRTVNGDRSLLTRDADGWRAYGWPVCGSSGICYNEAYPVEAIVMLHQAKTNQIEKLTGLGAIQKLMAQITINMWNAEFQMKAMDLIEKLISEVPVYELGCDISEEAVRCLEKVL